MPIKIVTDSTADLPADVVKELKITVVPCYINIGSQSYLDGKEIARHEFYKKLPTYKNHPTTSAPGIDAFVRAYRELLDEGAEGIISIHISQSLSNVANVARLAAEAVNVHKISIVDPGQLTLGTGLLVYSAAKMAANGYDLSAIVKMVEVKAKRTYSFAILNTLDFLRRSGRVSRLTAGLGSLLDIKPLLIMHKGDMKLEKIRTARGAMQRLVSLVERLGHMEEIALVYTHTLQKARDLQKMASHLFPTRVEIWAEEVTPVIGTHVGPGAVGIVCIAAG